MNIAIDLDGTLASWRHGGEGGFGVGDWMEDGAETLGALSAAGHKVVVHSCRSTWGAGGGWEAIAGFLVSGGFQPFLVTSLSIGGSNYECWQRIDGGEAAVEHTEGAWMTEKAVGIWAGVGKPIAHLYIDDRAFTFRNWLEIPAVVAQIEANGEIPELRATGLELTAADVLFKAAALVREVLEEREEVPQDVHSRALELHEALTVWGAS